MALTSFVSFLIRSFFAYIVGRRLVEPGLRVATVQRIVLLFACLTPFILWEYRIECKSLDRHRTEILPHGYRFEPFGA